MLEWKRFHEDPCCFTEDCVVCVRAAAGGVMTPSVPAAGTESADEKQVSFKHK